MRVLVDIGYEVNGMEVVESALEVSIDEMGAEGVFQRVCDRLEEMGFEPMPNAAKPIPDAVKWAQYRLGVRQARVVMYKEGGGTMSRLVS